MGRGKQRRTMSRVIGSNLAMERLDKLQTGGLVRNRYWGDDKSQNYGVITGDKRRLEDKIKWTW